MDKKDCAILILKVIIYIVLGFVLLTYVRQKIYIKPSERPVQIDTVKGFADAITENIGNICVEGTIDTTVPITLEETDGEYISVKRVKEELNSHTKTTYIPIHSGRTTTMIPSVRTYESWDEEETETENAETIIFCGKEFPSSKIQFREEDYEEVLIVNLSENSRYKYYGIRTGQDGILETKTMDGSISDGSMVYLGENLESFFVDSSSVTIICIVIGIIYTLFYWGTVALFSWIGKY